MPRPIKCRQVRAAPGVSYFKPRGVPMSRLTEVYLPLDGFEAIRLADLEGRLAGRDEVSTLLREEVTENEIAEIVSRWSIAWIARPQAQKPSTGVLTTICRTASTSSGIPSVGYFM